MYAGRIANGEVFVRTGIGFHATNNCFNENARGEILTCAFFAFAGRFFKQTLECRSLHVNVEASPFRFVDQTEQFL